MFDPFRKDLLVGQDDHHHRRGHGPRPLHGPAPGRPGREGGGPRSPARSAEGDRRGHPRGRGQRGCGSLRRARPGRGQGRLRRRGGRARAGQPAHQQRRRQLPRRVPRTSPPNAFNSVVQIVLYGTFHCTRELGRRLIERKQKGEILSIITTYAATGSAFVLPSAAAKAGVLAMMQGPGRGMGGLRHPPQRDRPRTLPHRGRLQPAHARLRVREAGPAPRIPSPPLRRALGADEPRGLPDERREPLPDRRRGHDRRSGGALLRPAVRGPRPPRPRAGQGDDVDRSSRPSSG